MAMLVGMAVSAMLVVVVFVRAFFLVAVGVMLVAVVFARVPFSMMMVVFFVAVPLAFFVVMMPVAMPFVPVLVVVVFLVLVVGVGGAFVDAEFDAFDGLAQLALEVHVEVADIKLREFPFEGGGFYAEVGEGAYGHVAADAGEAVEVEDFHGWPISSQQTEGIY